MTTLRQHRIAIIATDGVEELELLEPLRALRAEGAHVDVIAPHAGVIQSMHKLERGMPIAVDRVLSETVLPEQYDSLVLPGGALSVDALRPNPWVRRFVYSMGEAEKPIAAASHSPWLLISAGLVTNRRLTSVATLRDDLLNAGAFWADEPLVLDDNLLTARGATSELALFDTAMIALFEQVVPMISPQTRKMLSQSRIA